jgi:hypothetical protein
MRAGNNLCMSSCPDCGLDVDHCHGTLILHTDRTVDCTDAACQLPELLRHDFIIDCIDVVGGCCATEEPEALAAS